MTILHGEGYGITGERIISYARRIDIGKIPIPKTHRHRAQLAKLSDAECYIVKPIRYLRET